MKLVVEKIPDLQSLYIKQLRHLLSAEILIGEKTLTTSETAADSELDQLLRRLQQESNVHADRLREILGRLTDESSPLKCKVIYALFDEAEDLVQDAAHDAIRDVVLIAETQRIEHYQIAAYGTVRQFASVLSLEDDARALDQIVQDERRADHQLTLLAERMNPAARKAA